MEGKAEDGSWTVRAVPNRYPALTRAGNGLRQAVGLYRIMEGFGAHEVIIETPRHDRQPSRMSPVEMEAVVAAYLHRHRALESVPGIRAVILFRNHGPAAGTSLVHPHSQVIATGIVPGHIRRRDDSARAYFDDWGRCLFCDMLEQERRDRTRMVAENGLFAAFVPFAAGVPFEIWILPKAHRSCFSGMDESDGSSLAVVLRDVLGRLERACGDPDYNYVIHSACGGGEEAYLHWHLQLKPRLVTPAGFEMGSGIQINPSIPEEDAARLRESPA